LTGGEHTTGGFKTERNVRWGWRKFNPKKTVLNRSPPTKDRKKRPKGRLGGKKGAY